ncbi:MAG: 3-phosphoshikimate 1-carboxyvinyltransferase [Aquificaceae bacterium]|nr:3-phosphoshikimate 1-carboxyvinyltransferase [Aquificaceae bacterium]MCX8060650.1 3-phosphoshikimate 1-carboxyvinyltransferase [Aquificaceae bacterium]MDW8096765.1 3-phosphoshikimate 1-carboxyvinyltransferase [Aquificaceae bacterium]
MLSLERAKKVKGELRVPSDKSISHRAVIFSSLARGESFIKEWLDSADTRATLSVMRALGVRVKREGKNLRVYGRGYSLSEPVDVLNAKNSGTTARLMLGVLSTQPFFSTLTGDKSLRQRPMLRVVEPLRRMGADIKGRQGGDRLPVSVVGGRLKGISFYNEKSSAQVKSSLLLAGLRAEGYTQVVEPTLSRDHTERMLSAFGAKLRREKVQEGHLVELQGFQDLEATEIVCPADPSSASFFVALAALLEGSELLLKEVLVNPTRDRFFRKLKEMGASVSYEDLRELSGEPVADLRVEYSGRLKAVEVRPEEVPSLIDELPVLAVVMALAEGTSRVTGAQELRVKESDRIRAVVENLRAMGAKVEELPDGFEIEGVERLRSGKVKTYGDHRIAMAFSVAGLTAQGQTIIDDHKCVSVSYPEFYRDLDYILVR